MFSGHHDGMRGIAGGNCAYIAQSEGASIPENEIAEMQSSRSGCTRRWRTLRYTPKAVNAMPPTSAKSLAACITGVIWALIGRALDSDALRGRIAAPARRSARSVRTACQA